jgi:hypothetical protein
MVEISSNQIFFKGSQLDEFYLLLYVFNPPLHSTYDDFSAATQNVASLVELVELAWNPLQRIWQLLLTHGYK